MKRFFLLAVPALATPGILTGEMDFTMEEANKLVRLSALSYCDELQSPDVLDWSCETCIESGLGVVPGSVKFVNDDKDSNNNSQVLLGKLSNQPGCFLAFRGSHNIANWLSDFDLWYYDNDLAHYPDCDGCKVHEGFYNFWEALRDDVNRELDAIGCKDEQQDPVYITGHSLGGAIAHLAAFTLRDRGYKIATLYSFEAPRVGNSVFASTYNAILGSGAPHYRITHDHDPVVHAPPMNFGFTHVNTEVFFPDETGSDYKIFPDTEDKNGARQHDNIIWDLGYTSEHCGAPAFGNGFDICAPKCSKASLSTVVV